MLLTDNNQDKFVTLSARNWFDTILLKLDSTLILINIILDIYTVRGHDFKGLELELNILDILKFYSYEEFMS